MFSTFRARLVAVCGYLFNLLLVTIVAFGVGVLAEKNCPYIQKYVGQSADCCVKFEGHPCKCGCEETGKCLCKNCNEGCGIKVKCPCNCGCVDGKKCTCDKCQYKCGCQGDGKCNCKDK